METSGTLDLERKSVSPDLQGLRFYKPGVIATYCLLCWPVGLSLYGLNLARRGERVWGYVVLGFCGIAFLAAMAATITGASVTGVGSLGVIWGLGVWQVERGPYRHALSRGGVAASSWPPLLWVLGSILLLVLVAATLGPEEIAG